MYYLKYINYCSLENKLEIIDGLKCIKLSTDMYLFRDDFWGGSQLDIGKRIDVNKFISSNGKENYLYKCNDIKTKELEDGFTGLSFILNEPQEDNIDGIILFFPITPTGKCETSGTKIWRRYNDSIFLLKDNDYISFNNIYLKAVRNKLVQYIK